MKCVRLKVLVHVHVWHGRACLHLSTFVMSSHMNGKALSDEGNIDLKVGTLIDNRIIVLQMRPKMHVLFVSN